MGIRNYTSGIPSSRSIAKIEASLVEAGAKNLLKSYDEQKRLAGLMFQIEMPDKRVVAIELPARVDQLFQMLKEEHPRTGSAILYEQAERTAWKNLTEWVEIQLLLIRLQQVEFMEVFLPYMYDARSKRTFYQIARDQNFKNLLPAPEGVTS